MITLTILRRQAHRTRVLSMMMAAQFPSSVVAVSDSFLSNAGWLFFASWSAIIAVVGVVAFGRDLLPSRIQLDRKERTTTDPVHPIHPTHANVT